MLNVNLNANRCSSLSDHFSITHTHIHTRKHSEEERQTDKTLFHFTINNGAALNADHFQLKPCLFIYAHVPSPSS